MVMAALVARMITVVDGPASHPPPEPLAEIAMPGIPVLEVVGVTAARVTGGLDASQAPLHLVAAALADGLW